MGVRFPTAITTTTLGNVPSNGAETAILTTPGLTLPYDNAQVFISFYLAITSGGTALQWRIRQGSGITGNRINGILASITTVSGNGYTFSGCWVDTPGVVTGQQYTLTVQASGAGAPSTPADGCMMAYVL